MLYLDSVPNGGKEKISVRTRDHKADVINQVFLLKANTHSNIFTSNDCFYKWEQETCDVYSSLVRNLVLSRLLT